MRCAWVWERAAGSALDLVGSLPRVCFLCGRGGSGIAGWLCAPCRSLAGDLAPRCPACGRRVGSPAGGEEVRGPCRDCRVAPPPFRQVVAAGPYRGPLRWLLRRFKYGGESFLAHPLAGLMAAVAAPRLPPVDAWVPVPAGGPGVARRGYAQVALLVTALARTWPERRPVIHRALYRLPRARAQTGLRRAQRLTNAARAFAAGQAVARVAGLRVALVDDVLTTGATLAACTRLLLAAGAREVWCVVAAEASKPDRGARR